MTLPEVSIIVTCYNYGFWLHRCFRSLLNQKYVDKNFYEIIFIDDGSVDNSLSIAKNYSEKFPCIKILSNQTNQGLPVSCNKAIEESSGRFIVRVDADDYVTRDFVFFGAKFLIKNSRYQAMACDYVIIDEEENEIQRINQFEKEIACGIFFKREHIFDIGLYNSEFKMREGHELMQRFKNKYLVGRIELPLYKYQQHSKNRSNQEIIKEFDKKLKIQKEV